MLGLQYKLINKQFSKNEMFCPKKKNPHVLFSISSWFL